METTLANHKKKNTDNQMNQSELEANTWKGPKRGKIWFPFWLVTKVAKGKLQHMGKKMNSLHTHKIIKHINFGS